VKYSRRLMVVTVAVFATVIVAYLLRSDQLAVGDSTTVVPPTLQTEPPAKEWDTDPADKDAPEELVVHRPSERDIPDDILVTIEFPSGQLVDVVLHHFWPDEPPIKYNPRLVDMYNDLVVLAESGNGASARYLNQALRGCRNAFRDKPSKDAAIARLRSAGEITYPDGAEFPNQHVPVGRDIGEFIEVIEERFTNCEGVSDEQIAYAEYWRDEAIKAGDFLATRDYAAEIGVHTEAGFQIQKKLWDQGHISAVNGLGIAYRHGVPGENSGQPDYLKSYAYGYATFKLFEATARGSISPNTRNRLRSIEESLSNRGSYLTPQEQQAAIELAAEILEENKNCCLGVWNR